MSASSPVSGKIRILIVDDIIETRENVRKLLYFENDIEEFKQQFREYGYGRRLFGTEYSLGFGPENIKEGDEVWQLDGANVLLVLRYLTDGNYKVVGECYLHSAFRTQDCCILCPMTTPRQLVRPLWSERKEQTFGKLSTSTGRIPKDEQTAISEINSTQVIHIR